VLKPLFALAVSAALLGATAAYAAMVPTQFPLAPQNESGEHGTATLLQGVNGVIVRLRVAGAPASISPRIFTRAPAANSIRSPSIRSRRSSAAFRKRPSRTLRWPT
jgi:hypothetical protein